MEFLADYGVFLLKVITIALAITIPLLIIIGSSKSKTPSKGSLVVKNLSKKYEDMGTAIRSSQLNPKELKKYNKDYKYIIKGEEGHGFRRETARLELFQDYEEFLTEHLN